MQVACEGPGDQIMDLLDPCCVDLIAASVRFGKAYLTFILGKDVLAITRTAIHEGAGSSLGSRLFEQGPGRAIPKMTVFLPRR